jgi:hypothetical protein
MMAYDCIPRHLPHWLDVIVAKIPAKFEPQRYVAFEELRTRGVLSSFFDWHDFYTKRSLFS